eukprot:jgi/Tetstr1/449670/TSEL_036738.t1
MAVRARAGRPMSIVEEVVILAGVRNGVEAYSAKYGLKLRWIVIYLTESEFDPSELLIHPFSQTIREAGELGGNTGHNLMRRAAIGIPLAANLASLAAKTHQLRNPQRLSIQLERHPSQPTPASKSKAATTAKHKKKQPRGRSRSDGTTRNRSRSKLRLSGAHGSDSEWETDEEAAHPSSNSHQ